MQAISKIIALSWLVVFSAFFPVFFVVDTVKADTGPWQGTDEVQLRLISATTHHDGAATLNTGLQVKLADGWKIYWRSPGDAGLPPVLDFSQNTDVSRHEMRFPAPERFTLFGLETFGYGKEVVFPLTLTLDQQATNSPAKNLTLVAAFSGLVCADLCIPVDEVLTLRIPSGTKSPSQHAFAIAQAEALVPSEGTSNGYHITSARIAADQLDLVIANHSGDIFTMGEGDVLIETDIPGLGFQAPQFGQGLARIAITGGEAKALIGSQAVITVIHPDFMFEQVVTIDEGTAITVVRQGLVSIILIAFLGGLILNIMPCVLPVITIKLAGVLGHDQAALPQVRKSFLLSASGIILSFLLLGLILLIMRQTGAAIGWGVQFQNPYFLGFMALVMMGFALMMLDVVTLPVPQFAQRLSRRFDQASRGVPDGHGNTGSHRSGWNDLASGAMATLLATPCSAPFVGTAVAFAFTASPWLMMTVFLAMALGLAAPWLLVAAVPGLAAFLPRPGKWLIWVRRLLALGLLVTATWLVFVLMAVLSGDRTLSSGDWQKWQPRLAESLASDGKVVLVDVTADWCLTCKANQIFVLQTETVQQFLKNDDVVLLQADWTRPDDQILEYLTSFGRYGIPFNAIYGPGLENPLILPELLTVTALSDAIELAISRPNY
jgi:suppressor for copper-sensitivity B